MGRGLTALFGIRNDNLFSSIATERRQRSVCADEVVETKLIIGIHENGIDPELRVIRPTDSCQPHGQRLRLSRNMQMQLEEISGLQPFESGSRPAWNGEVQHSTIPHQ